MAFDSFSSNIDEVLSINTSANVFIFGNVNIHHKNWLAYSAGELCYSFSISNDLTQMVNFPTRISDCDSHSLALLDLFLTSDASICSAMAFPPLENSDNIVVSVSVDSPLTVASSVQVAILQITLSKKSLMYSRKSVGPRMEP